MSSKVLSRQRKQRQKDDMKQEIVAQVHKCVRKEHNDDRENINNIEKTEDTTETKRTFILEDKNDNCSVRTPSRDVSVDGESQINSKILNLIETEMRRDINKISHFTDSRPQSLSFYEEEKIPEELSGNLELLSPEERKHYKRRKEYGDIDMERNAYNNMQDALSRANDDVVNGSSKKSKSRKKKHAESELGLGDSREMMIPKEKRKSKKKKCECSPLSSSSGKRKHKKREENYEPKNEITLALEELQDDVFENGPDEFVRSERMKKSPRKSDKLYIQRKNRFEVSYRNDQNSYLVNMPSDERSERGFFEYHAVHLAVLTQKNWKPIALLCHGLLGGLALAHYFYFYTNGWAFEQKYINYYANYSDLYTCLFFMLCVICIISVFDRYDVSHISIAHLPAICNSRKSLILVLIYTICFILHLVTAQLDDKMGLISLNTNISSVNITKTQWARWGDLSYWRSIFAVTGWIIIAFSSSEDLFYNHLKTMEKYVVD